MRRLFLQTVPVTLLVLVALGNWETTCCCGRSCLLEFLQGGCGEHGADAHHPHGHHAGDDTGCYKDGAENFLASQPDALRPDLSAGGGPAMYPAGVVAWSGPAAGGGRPGWYPPTPPDPATGLSLLHCALLI